MNCPASLLEKLAIFSNRWVVVYCYPKDDTPGCTIEAKEFSLLSSEFQQVNTAIVGISPQSDECHKKFIEKYALSVVLIADEEKNILQDLDVWQEKKNYGKTYMGVVRSTFIVDTESKTIIKEWRNVKAEGHATKVLDYIHTLL